MVAESSNRAVIANGEHLWGIEYKDKLSLTKKEVCYMLSISASYLYSLEQKDSTFPKRIKLGLTQQAMVMYDKQDVINWWYKKKEAANNSVYESTLAS